MLKQAHSKLRDIPVDELCAMVRILVFCKFYFAKDSWASLKDHELEIMVDLTLYLLVINHLLNMEPSQIIQDSKMIDRCLSTLFRNQKADPSIKKDLDACLDRFLPNLRAIQ